MNADDLKKQAAARALELVRPGMRLGLGTGSTAKHFVDLLGVKVAAGFEVLCVSTSEATQAQAVSLGIPMSTLDETPELDLTVDGADEVDPQLRLIKGGGAALLREKLVWEVSRRCVVIADAGKRVARLGACPLPIEVVPFGHRTTAARIRSVLDTCGIGGPLDLRQGPDGPVVTDNGNLIYDARCGAIDDPATLATCLKATTGVVEHGLFVALATDGLVGTDDGVRHLARAA